MRRLINNFENHTNWFGYYKYKYFGKRTGDFNFNCRSGISINVPHRLLHTYKECFFDETYLKGLPKELSKSPIKTIIDIGANVGYFSLFMFSLNVKAKVFAYEPIPKNFDLLNQYKSENPDLNFQIFNMAVTKPNQKSITLHYDESDAFTTSASIFNDQKQKNKLVVGSTSLERIIQDHQLSKVDLVKLDCEGSEYEILYNTPGTIFDKISILAIETHQGNNENENTYALSKYIKEHNFKIKTQGDIIWAWKNDR